VGGPRNLLLLVTLVIAAASSGYLWRAALESPHVRTIVRVAPPVATKSTVTVTPKQAAHLQATSRKPRRRHSSLGAQPEAVASAPLAPSVPAAAVVVVTSPSRPAPKPKPKTGSPSPAPAPAPAPKPKPPEPPRAPEPKPKPAAPPPATTTTTTSAPPSEQRPPHEEKKPVSDREEQKPGWGKGDENHDHGGPPGRGG
jgi:hypothetical protein